MRERTSTISRRWPRCGPPAPSPGEFGAGLLIAESYAMAVEMLAAVECILAGEGHAVGSSAPG